MYTNDLSTGTASTAADTFLSVAPSIVIIFTTYSTFMFLAHAAATAATLAWRYTSTAAATTTSAAALATIVITPILIIYISGPIVYRALTFPIVWRHILMTR